jgi:hypothetical protein
VPGSQPNVVVGGVLETLALAIEERIGSGRLKNRVGPIFRCLMVQTCVQWIFNDHRTQPLSIHSAASVVATGKITGQKVPKPGYSGIESMMFLHSG